MRLRALPLEIPKDDPFKYDALGRKPFVESLTNLISSVTPPFVICVDAPWGFGKTTFLRMWDAHLHGSAPSVLRFNAWETDFAADPLVAFVSAIAGLAAQANPKGANSHRIEQLKKIGAQLAKRAVPVGVKVLSAGLLRADDFTEEAMAGLAESLTGDAIANFESKRQLIDEFHDVLTSLVSTLPESGGESRLLVLIDELDRCRPPYALELLERVKHVLNVPNVVFAFALDRRQLMASVESVYGHGVRSDEYLRRFFDLEFVLPRPKADAFTESLFGQFDFGAAFAKRTHHEFRYDVESIKTMFNALADLFDLSLRTREQCFTRLRVALLVTGENQYLYPDLTVALIVLRAAAYETYQRYVVGDAYVAEIMKLLESKAAGQQFVHSRAGLWLEALLVRARESIVEDGVDRDVYERLQSTATGDQNDPKRDRADKILDILNDMRRSRATTPNLKMLVSKIEMGLRTP